MSGNTGNRATGVATTILARAPEFGCVKSRLAAAIGDDAALAVHEAMALDTITGLRTWTADLVLSLTGADDACHRFALLARGAAPLVRLERQVDGDLGARIEACFDRRLAEGHRSSLVVGTDCVELNGILLDEAVAALAQAPVVLAPADDGGFVLIGARGALPQGLLARVAWGTPSACAGVVSAAVASGTSTRLVASASDVDDLASLQALASRLLRGDSTAPRTAACLARLGIPLRLPGHPR
jgi:rSAM/selenodomain-associated transferase 1